MVFLVHSHVKVSSCEKFLYHDIHIYIHIYTYMYSICIEARGGCWVPSPFPVSLPETRCPTELDTAMSARLTSQWAPGIYLFSSSFCWGYCYMHPCLAFYVDPGDMRLGPACIHSSKLLSTTVFYLRCFRSIWEWWASYSISIYFLYPLYRMAL